MSAKARKLVIGCCASLSIASGWLAPSLASRPVPRTIVGCVFDGKFISSDGYHIRPRYADGRELDLARFEGHGLTISGALLPGDALIVKQSPHDSGPCTIMRPR
jgi:hypothetical protein